MAHIRDKDRYGLHGQPSFGYLKTSGRSSPGSTRERVCEESDVEEQGKSASLAFSSSVDVCAQRRPVATQRSYHHRTVFAERSANTPVIRHTVNTSSPHCHGIATKLSASRPSPSSDARPSSWLTQGSQTTMTSHQPTTSKPRIYRSSGYTKEEVNRSEKLENLVSKIQSVARAMARPKHRQSKTPEHAPCWEMEFLSQIQLPDLKEQVVAYRRQDRRRAKPHRPRRAKLSRQTSFLDLPNELRIKIYNQAVPRTRVLVRGSKPNLELQAMRCSWTHQDSTTVRPYFRLSHRALDSRCNSLRHEITINLLLSCREIKTQVEEILYTHTTFQFTSAKVLHRFLGRVPLYGLRLIRSIELCQSGYRLPKVRANGIYRRKYYDSWNSACRKAAERMTGLVCVKVYADVYDEMLDSVDMASSLACRDGFAKFGSAGVEHARVSLRHPLLTRETVVDLARSLEDQMMTETGREERDRDEASRVLEQVKRERSARLLAERQAEAEEYGLLPPAPQREITMSDILSLKNKRLNVPTITTVRRGTNQYCRIDATATHGLSLPCCVRNGDVCRRHNRRMRSS